MPSAQGGMSNHKSAGTLHVRQLQPCASTSDQGIRSPTSATLGLDAGPDMLSRHASWVGSKLGLAFNAMHGRKARITADKA
eukprot:363664-Chlamydomonas_euryale.AAC.17